MNEFHKPGKRLIKLSMSILIMVLASFVTTPLLCFNAYGKSLVGKGDSDYLWQSTNGPGQPDPEGNFPECSSGTYNMHTKRLYASTYNSEYSNRGGVWFYDGTWHDTNTLRNYKVVDLVSNPNNGNIYAATEEKGVWLYNGSWHNLDVPTEYSNVYCLAVASSSGILYAGGYSSDGNVFYYDGSWHTIENSSWGDNVSHMVWDNKHNRLYTDHVTIFYDIVGKLYSYSDLYYYDGSDWQDTDWFFDSETEDIVSMAYDSSRDRLWVGGEENLYYYTGSFHKATDSSGRYLSYYPDALTYDTSSKTVYATMRSKDDPLSSFLCTYDGSWNELASSNVNVDEPLPVIAGEESLTVDSDKGIVYGSGPGVWACQKLAAQQTWYFAEGSTAHGFEEYILVQNASSQDANVYMRFMTPDNTYRSNIVPLPPNSRTTVYMNDVLPNVDASIAVYSLNTPDVICERAMYWQNKIEGHDSIGITSLSPTWYLPEGCTGFGYEEWVCLQNPSDTEAQVNVTYMTDSGPIAKAPFTMPPNSRETIDVRSDIGERNVSTKVEASSPIAAERAMYWDNRRGGHCSIGTNQPSNTYYLAEGSTLHGFDEYVLVQNPFNATVTIDISYLTPNGEVSKPPFQIPPQSRYTVHVNEDIAAEASTKVTSREGPIIAERSMYWNNGTGKAGHDTIGVPTASKEICFAEGCTYANFEEWLSLMNPNPVEATANITYMKTNGTENRSVLIPPKSRITINVPADLYPYAGDVSAKITSDSLIMAERPMYWNNRSGGHVSIGYSPLR